MKNYKIHDILTGARKYGAFKKYFDGKLKSISLKGNIVDKLRAIIEKNTFFNDMNDMMIFFIYHFETQETLYKYHMKKLAGEYNFLKRFSYETAKRADYFSMKSDKWKEKALEYRDELKKTKEELKEHKRKEK